MRILNMRVEDPMKNFATRVDRGSEWGNPFIMHREAQRDEVIAKFQAYAKWRLELEPEWLAPLRGFNLACWCAPKHCHAEILMELANR